MSDLFELFRKIAAKPASTGAPTAIVCGLGNPGPEYVFTRHNAGFLAMDYFSQKLGAELKTAKFKALTTITTIGGERVLLMKPQTYMNHSGEAVSAAAAYYKIPPEKIIVISDDVCQAPGRMRIRKSGSDGGQKGLRSIIEHLGGEVFPRVKIGVGACPAGGEGMISWVLGRPEPSDRALIALAQREAAEAPAAILAKGADAAKERFNGFRVPDEKGAE